MRRPKSQIGRNFIAKCRTTMAGHLTVTGLFCIFVCCEGTEPNFYVLVGTLRY